MKLETIEDTPANKVKNEQVLNEKWNKNKEEFRQNVATIFTKPNYAKIFTYWLLDLQKIRFFTYF